MSVVERFKARRTVSPVVDVEFSGVVLKIARVSKVELEKAGKISRKELRDEGIEPESVENITLTLSRMAAVGSILESHVKGWDIPEVPCSKDTVKEFFQEMSYDERVVLGLKYMQACEADEEQKKTINALLLILNASSGNASGTNLEPQA